MANVLRIPKPETQVRCEQRQSKLAALAEKKAKGKLALEDIDEKLNIILELLQEK